MFRVLFLILFLMGSVAFAQKRENPASSETPKAVMLEEFAAVPNGQLRMMLDTFFLQLQNDPNAQGYIFNYGTRRQISRREKLFRNHITFRNVDASRITFARGKTKREFGTQFWIAPAGAELPTP